MKLYDALGERETPSGSVNNPCHLEIGLRKLPSLLLLLVGGGGGLSVGVQHPNLLS